MSTPAIDAPVVTGSDRVAETELPTWALVVATYNRGDILGLCVQAALAQTRRPREVVIVDASDDWRRTLDEIVEPLLAESSGIDFRYEAARVKSVTCQRNQALESVTADVSFLIDDDSLLHADAAERLLAIYAADGDRGLGGVELCPSSASPFDVGNVESVQPRGRRRPRFDFLFRKVLMGDKYEQFIPYDGRYPMWELPEAVASLPVSPVRLMQGYRMTYWTETIRRIGFDADMRYYSLSEDIDASYRASRLGPLVRAERARVYHHAAASGRIDRYARSAQRLLNQALCLRKHSSNLRRDRGTYRRRAVRRMLIEGVKDLARGRWSMPQCRGSWRALRESARIFDGPREELSEWFPELQRTICRRP